MDWVKFHVYISAMDMIPNTNMVSAAILGTLVADASGMGLHWIYSQGKIAQIVKKNSDIPEFLEPDRANYEGAPAFFAHPHRHAGDASNYGEYLYVLLRAVDENGFDASAYIRVFSEYFGVGGEYVGYADGPMRETVFNITRFGKEIEKNVLSIETTLDDEKRKSAAHYISRYFFEHDAEGLKQTVRTPFKLQQWKADELEEVDRIIDEVSRSAATLGPDDDQMPALSRSAVLAHFYAGDELDAMTERAVRITNDNDDAVAYSLFFARIMRDLYEAGPPASGTEAASLRSFVERHVPSLPGKARELVERVLAESGLDYRGATKTYGAACHVHMAVPLSLHILLNTTSFVEANRANILASGDNCGRAVMLGAIAGALYGVGGDTGVPTDWIDRCSIVAKVRATPGGRLLLGETE
ncbi:MAG: ADP-ribosylglycohydrolase family protein [Spirochaetaceae bacterium]|nr:MAG: ADP-ribosylglycohydrolase family protein [Spirochaetaceae bacterium]